MSTAIEAAGSASKATPEPEPEVYSDRWEMIWSAGLDRGQRWDAAAASPALVNLLRSGRVKVDGKRVLVPGCGRGYDLPVFLSAGAREAVGLELSATAAREATAYLAEVRAAGAAADAAAGAADAPPKEAEAEAAGASARADLMRVEVGDFFTWSGPQGDGSWDVGFDYTFGCAMHPTMRRDWATHWARHLGAGALLVALVFPIRPTADPNVGPPFPVSPELYTELLAPAGFECLSCEPVPHELSHSSRVGQEALMLWRRL